MRIVRLFTDHPLINLLKPYRRALMGAFAALSIAAAIVISIGWGLHRAVDATATGLNASLINRGLLFSLGVAGLLALTSFIRSSLGAWISERAVVDLKQKLFAHLLQLDRAFYAQARVGDLMAHLQTDLTLIQTLLGSSLTTGMRSLIQLIGALILLLLTSAKLFGLVLLLLPLVLIPVVGLGSRVRKVSQHVQAQHGRVTAFIEEALNAVTTYQAYTNEAVGSSQFAALQRQGLHLSRQRIVARGLLVALVMMAVVSGVSVVLWIGIKDVLIGVLTPGQMVAFIFYAVIAAGSLNSLSEMWGDVQNANGACGRLMELLATESKVRASFQPSSFPYPFETICFENVTFAYPVRPEINVLENFSLTLKAGESVAIVGPSGAGKSTLFHLLMRFYDPIVGRIMLNGKDLREIDLNDLRSHIGWLSQDPVIFASTVEENIRFGSNDADSHAIIEVARAAQAYDFIQRLPEGFQTELGERGVRLSGGQRQRIALARALLKNPSLLLLDEATNAIDSESERLIHIALDRIMQGCTTLIIAHRLSTALMARRIIVMDQGQIIGDGTHMQLLKECAWYRRFAGLQGGTVMPLKRLAV